jgi:hypothetical protein
MEVRSIVERKKFLGLMCKPSKGICCKSLTLKAGVIIGSAVDIVIGILNFFDLGMMIRDHRKSMTSLETAAVTVDDIVCLLTIPFAFIGLAGVLNSSAEQVHKYSVYKRIEAVFLSIFTMFFYLLIICPIYDCDLLLSTIITLVRSWYNLYIAYIVWSADVRLQHNEGILVMHGETVVKLMDQQAATLVPNVQIIAMPGQFMQLVPTGTPISA